MHIRKRIIEAGLVAAVLSLAACENTISPRADNAENVVAIYGYLDTWQSPQIVKVSPLRATVLAEIPLLEGLAVRSRETGTSENVLWSDTTLVGESGTGGMFFKAAFLPKNGETYILEVLRNGTVIARARTTVPAVPSFEVDAPQGDTTNLSQEIRIYNVERAPNEITVDYTVSRTAAGDGITFEKKYVPPGLLSAMQRGWKFDVFLKRDLRSIAVQLGVTEGDPPPILRGIGMLVRVRSEEYDRPDRPGNLENAHGFFGSYGTYEFAWALDSASVAILGYEGVQSGTTGAWTRSSGGLDNQFEPF